MKLKHCLLLLLSQLFLLNTFAQNDRQTAVQQFVHQAGLEHASIGFCVKDFDGKVIANYEMDKSYTPASILKVVTTATAFEVLGADYKYETTLARGMGSASKQLIISGKGDPTLGTEHLDNNSTAFVNIWANSIASAFHDNHNIDILVKDDYFGYRGVSRKWIHEDMGNYYAAASYGISVFDNTYRLSFNTKGEGTTPEIVGTSPKMNDIKFTNTLGVNNKNEDNGYILGALLSNDRLIIGDIPANRTRFTIKGDIPNPGLYLGQTIATALTEKNIKVGKVETAYNSYFENINKPQAKNLEQIFYVHQSPTLSDIARDVNVRSNNHYAEHLIRSIGRLHNNDIYSLALEEGIKGVKELWEDNGLRTDNLFMYDGCGLAPTNAVSAEFMCDILGYMQTKSQNGLPFLNTFAKAGKEGTVRNLLKGTRLDGKVYVKSGSIANVQCFAGYYIDGDKKYTFTIMVNKYNAPRNQVVKSIERLLLGTLK